MSDNVNHPDHYGGADNPYEAIKVIEHMGWGEGFCLGNALKYIMRAGKKPGVDRNEDLQKAIWYLQELSSTPPEPPEAISHYPVFCGLQKSHNQHFIQGSQLCPGFKETPEPTAKKCCVRIDAHDEHIWTEGAALLSTVYYCPGIYSPGITSNTHSDT